MSAAADSESAWRKKWNSIPWQCLLFFFFPTKINHTGEQKVSGFSWRVLVSWVLVLLCPLFISFFLCSIIFQHPQKNLVIFLCVCVWDSFPLISSYFFSHSFISFHQGQTAAAPTWKAPLPVVLFLILSVCILSLTQVKATFTTPLQSESSCRCCSRQYTTADCACQGIYRSYTHTRFAGLAPTPARAHAPQTSTLCPCCCAGVSLCCVIASFFNVAIWFSL